MASSSNDEYVDEENVFLSMLDELHKPDEPNELFPMKFAYYFRRFLQIDHPDLYYLGVIFDGQTMALVKLTSGEEDIIEDIIGKIATEIAMSAVNDVDIHTTTLAILKILQCFCWETKLIFTVVAYITTYGDMGLNLCPKSKAFTSGLPNSIIKLLRDDLITINKSVEYVQRDQESAGIIMGSHVEDLWIHFKIAVYQAIKVIVEVASSHLMTRSTLEYKRDTSITTRWNEKHEVIIDEYFTTRKELLKVLQLFEVVEEISEFRRRLKFEIDAVKPETLEVNVIDQQLVVKGDRNNLHGPFDQRFQLPNDTRKEEIKAKFGSGILWIDLPKIQKFGQKDITIPIEYL